MNKNKFSLIFILAFSVLNQSCSKPEGDIKIKVNWPEFMSRNDMVWTQMPDGWTSGAFTGNGILGTIFWRSHKVFISKLSEYMCLIINLI